MLLDASAAAAAAPELPAAAAGLGLRVFTTRRLTVPGFPLAVINAAAFAEDDAVPAELSAVVDLAARGVAPATRDCRAYRYQCQTAFSVDAGAAAATPGS